LTAYSLATFCVRLLREGRIEITARARDDADAAHAWMTEHISSAFAEKWYQELFKQIETLARHPASSPFPSRLFFRPLI